MVSAPEKEIAAILSTSGREVRMGYRIENKKWLYDIFLPTEKIIIEFNGDYWHMNPNKHSSSDYNKTAHRTAEEIWKRDEEKRNDAISSGYKIFYIWESDYKKSPNKFDMVMRILENV